MHGFIRSFPSNDPSGLGETGVGWSVGRRVARVGFRGRTERLAQVPWALRPSPASGHPSRCLLDRTGRPARGAGRPVTWKPGAGQYLQSMPRQVGTPYTSRAQEGWAWSSCSDGPSCSPNRAPFPHGDADSPRRSDGACDCGMYSIDCGRKARPQARPFSCVCVCSRRERWQSSRLRRCDLVRITCQIPDRDVMRRSTIEVPLARGLRDGGDGVVRTIAQAPSAGITPLHSHYPSLCCAAWRDTSCGSVAPLLTLPGCLPRQAALLGILQPRKSLVSCDAALPRPAGRCRAET